MNSKCAKRIFTSSRSSSWHQLLSSLILLSITIESKHFFSQQMENLTQTQKCLWLSHIVTFPKKLSKKVVQIKVSVFNSLKLVIIMYRWILKKKEKLNKREYLGPVWPADVWPADDIPFCSIFTYFQYSLIHDIHDLAHVWHK